MGQMLLTGAGGGASGLGLKTNLTAWWALDEASGARADSHTNAYTLTDNNTVTSTADGTFGTVATFTNGNNESLSRTGIGAFGSGVSRSFSFWWKDTTAGTTTGAILSRDDGTTREWAITTGNTRFTFVSFDSVGTPVTLDSLTDFAETFAKNAWHHGIVWFNHTNSTLNYRVDGGTARSKAIADYIRGGGAVFRVGHSTYYNTADLQITRVGMWNNYILTADQQTLLYNAGAGRVYAEL